MNNRFSAETLQNTIDMLMKMKRNIIDPPRNGYKDPLRDKKLNAVNVALQCVSDIMKEREGA